MSGASAMRNAVKRITHKERAQPAARKKLGLLEKHKDYVVRANDFKKKKGYIKTLKKKAADRNPDEFYFKMNSTKVDDKGIHRDIIDGSMDHSTIQLLKSQDMGYIVHKKSIDLRKIEKMKDSLHLIGAKNPKKHTVFVDSEEDLKTFDTAAYFDTPAELVDCAAHNRPKMAQLEEMATRKLVTGDVPMSVARTNAITKAINKKVEREMEKSYGLMYERTNRAKKLNKVAEKLQLQRNLMNSKGTKTKLIQRAGEQPIRAGKRKRGETVDKGEDLGKGDKVIFKWKRQRSK